MMESHESWWPNRGGRSLGSIACLCADTMAPPDPSEEVADTWIARFCQDPKWSQHAASFSGGVLGLDTPCFEEMYVT